MKSYNLQLDPLPTDDEFIAAVEELHAERPWRVSANDVAYRLGVRGAARLGNGAVKGSWSGRMSGSLRVSPRLRSLVRQGRLGQSYDYDYRRRTYHPKEAA